MKCLAVTLLLLATCACSSLATIAPTSVDLSGTWLLDPKRSDDQGPKDEVGGTEGTEARQTQAETPTTRQRHRL